MISPVFGQTGDRYVQTNLVSDVPGLAAHTDPNLVNAWGITAGPTTPWWVNSAGRGLSLVYDANGNPFPIANPIRVTIPPPGGSVPTGIVFNGTTDFAIAPGRPANFLFASATGTISGWNGAISGSTATIVVTTPGAAYTGLTIGQMGGANFLYAANFAAGRVDVFDANFARVTLPAGAFQDPTIPAGFAPFNIENIGGNIFVTFAKQGAGESVNGPGLGFVDKFSSNGALLLRLQTGSWMNAPWAVVMAPAGFGTLSGQLLVGQFGSGQIAAFNAQTGQFTGLMLGINGAPIEISGLWGLRFGNGATAGSPTDLYFAAGINDEANGLFGRLSVNPQISAPATLTVNPGQSTTLPLTIVPVAGPEGVAITLTSSNPSVASVSPNAFVFGGASSPDRRGPIVTGGNFGTATITATAPGRVPVTVTVTVTLNMSFLPSSVTLTGTALQARPLLTISAPAPAGGLTVNLTSSNPGVVSVPTTVFIPAGSTSVAVPVTPLARGTATVRASVSSFVTDALLSVTVN